MKLLLDYSFLVPTFVVGFSAIIHATGYLHGDGRRRAHWFYTYLFGTLCSMICVVQSKGFFDFLIAWEAMGLFSAGLVGFESESKAARQATWIYLLACQVGALFLILAYSMGHNENIVLFWYLMLIGFGLKIGFPPFHVWLPEAHPAAPAPASAVMSGAMIPLGFYGLIRFFYLKGSHYTFISPAIDHVAASLLVGGLVAALGGILFALPQRNIKRLLAFSSVENMGVIALGLSLAVYGYKVNASSIYEPAVIGALLHVINHALLKGGLFLGAGSVLRMTGTLDIDKLGGLMKRMPGTGTIFTLNALGLSGLPPLNGFVSEFFIYVASFNAFVLGKCLLPASIVLVTLALTGGFAVAVYTKVVSGVFLGEARSDLSSVTETPRRMVFAQAFLFALSLLVSFGAAWWAQREYLYPVFAIMVSLYSLVFILLVIRRILPFGKVHPHQMTWDCGYASPTARMAWTGTAFSQPLADTFKGLLRPRIHIKENKSLFPGKSAFAIESDDAGMAHFWSPIFHYVARLFQRMHLLQNGSLHFYVLLMIFAVIALLVWGALS